NTVRASFNGTRPLTNAGESQDDMVSLYIYIYIFFSAS
ncbi:MAG: hypothetical protein ACI9W3_001198, partial [Marinoscillum sp.]